MASFVRWQIAIWSFQDWANCKTQIYIVSRTDTNEIRRALRCSKAGRHALCGIIGAFLKVLKMVEPKVAADLACPDESWQCWLMVCSGGLGLHGEAAVLSVVILLKPSTGWALQCQAGPVGSITGAVYRYQHCPLASHLRLPSQSDWAFTRPQSK